MNKISKNILGMLSVLSYVGIVFSYSFLPEQIPIHWNYRWETDGWSDKKCIFLMGLLPIIFLLLFEYLPKFDPRGDNYRKHAKAYNIFEIAITLLLIILNWFTILASLKADIKINLLIPAAMGVVFILLGNYMPTLKSNYFMGIRNPWTLSDDVVWRKTHKVGGYLFIVIGLLMVIMSFIQANIINGIVFTFLIAAVIGINIYSYLIYRKIRKNL